MKFPIFSSTSIIGLDIQPHELRLIQLRKTNKGFWAEKAAIIKMPDEIFADSKIRNWDGLRQVLAESVQELDLTGAATAINLPVNLVRMQRIQVPIGISDVAIMDEIKIQLERDFPGLGDSLSIDFKIIHPSEPGYLQVFFVVTRQEYVSQYVNCINSTGLKVKIVDVDVYALKRIFNIVPSHHAGEICALACHVNLKASLMIFTEYEIIFHRQWDSENESEFAAQLKNQMQIFLATFSDKKISTLMICGNDLQEINVGWDFEVQYPSPFASIKLSQTLKQQINQENFPSFLVACGCAMQEVPRW